MPNSIRWWLIAALFFALFSNSCAHRATQAPEVPDEGPQFDISEENQTVLVLINQSAEPLDGLFLRPHRHPEATENLLEDVSLPVGQSVTLHGVPAGTWDILVQDVRGQTRTYAMQKLSADHEYSLIIDAYHWE